MEVNDRLKEIRKERRLNQRELAEKIGISLRSLQRYEDGTKFPDIAVLKELADSGYNLHWFITGEGEKKITENQTINPLLKEVNEWLNDQKRHNSASFRILFNEQMIRAFFDYEEWKRKRDKAESGKSGLPTSKVA